MGHTIEPAASGRAKCRACGERIAKGELRLGARLPNPFDDASELTLWFHLRCGAYARPEPFLEAAKSMEPPLPDGKMLEAEARRGLEHRRLPRLRRLERAPTGRASCRHCREPIPKNAWRITLAFYDEVEGRFSPGGFIHVSCAGGYFGTADVLARLLHFTPALEPPDVEEIRGELSMV